MSVRNAKLALADARALEEEAERENPVNPKHQIGVRKGRTSLVQEGHEMTGGAKHTLMDHIKHPKKGFGKKGLLGEKQTPSESAGQSEAHRHGVHLGKHLHSLYGGAYHGDFARGFSEAVGCGMSGGNILSRVVGGGATPSMGLSQFRGGADTGAYEGEGRSGGVGRSGGASAKRSARAALVKKLMAEEGLSLGAASKAVKERGLQY